MKRIHIVLSIVFLCWLTCQSDAGTNAFAAEKATQSKTNWSDTVEGLRLRIWTDKEAYQTNEAIRLSMELNNVSSQELAVVTAHMGGRNPDDRAPLYDVEKVIVSTGHGEMLKTWELYPVDSQMFSIQGMVSLQPNGTVIETSRLNSHFWRPQSEGRLVSFQFPSGTYRIQVVYAFEKPKDLGFVKRWADEFAAKGIKCWAGKLVSNTVEIRVLDNVTL